MSLCVFYLTWILKLILYSIHFSRKHFINRGLVIPLKVFSAIEFKFKKNIRKRFWQDLALNISCGEMNLFLVAKQHLYTYRQIIYVASHTNKFEYFLTMQIGINEISPLNTCILVIANIHDPNKCRKQNETLLYIRCQFFE